MTRPNTPTLAHALRAAIDARMVDVHTSLPARVESYDAATQKVSVQPLLKRGYLDEAGDRAVEQLPVITDVPVVFPGAGGFRVTFPIAQGDTVLLVFSEASIDQWLVKGGLVDPGDDRRHTMNDAIAIPGLRDFRNALSSAPTDAMTAGMDGGPVIEFDTDEIRVGGSEALALKSDVESLRDEFLAHFHIAAGSNTGGPVSAGIPPVPIVTIPITGTDILKGS